MIYAGGPKVDIPLLALAPGAFWTCGVDAEMAIAKERGKDTRPKWVWKPVSSLATSNWFAGSVKVVGCPGARLESEFQGVGWPQPAIPSLRLGFRMRIRVKFPLRQPADAFFRVYLVKFGQDLVGNGA